MEGGDETTQREADRKIDSGDDSRVRDVATCHHFSPLLLEMHHQSLGGSMTRGIIITHTDTHIHTSAHTHRAKHKAYFKV